MSHVTVVATQIDDKGAVKAAAQALKIRYEENVTANLGYGNKVRGDIVLTLQSGAQVAMVLDKKTGIYQIHCDLYSGAIARELGQNFSKLKQMFSLKKVEIAARKKGYRASKPTVKQDGSIQIHLW
jgi:hypothetical protein